MKRKKKQFFNQNNEVIEKAEERKKTDVVYITPRVKEQTDVFSFKVFLTNLILFCFIVVLGVQFYVVYNFDVSDETKALYDTIAFDLTYLSSEYILEVVSYNENDYLYYENVKLFNVFNEFVETSLDNGVKYTLYNDSGNQEVSLAISIYDSKIYSYTSKSNVKEYNYFDLIFGDVTSDDLISEYLINNNINNEYEFLISLNSDDFDTNLLSDLNELKTNYAIGNLINDLFTDGDKTLITGEYIGYIDEYTFNDVITTNIVLIKNEIVYNFTINNSDYYTTNEIDNIINSIIVE